MISTESLCAAAALSCEAYVAHVTAAEDGEEMLFSPAFERKMARLKRRADHPLLVRTVRRAAAFLLALLLVGAAWIAIDSDARAAFLGWIGSMENGGFTYRLHPPRSAAADMGESAEYFPAWIPEGYREFKIESDEDGTNVIYVNDAGTRLRFNCIYYNSDPDQSSALFIDHPDGLVEETTVRGCPAVLFLPGEENASIGLSWVTAEETLIFISGFISREEILRMAESAAPVYGRARTPPEWAPAWLPEGYVRKSGSGSFYTNSVKYINAEGAELWFFRYWNTEEAMPLDLSGTERRETTVRDFPAEIYLAASPDKPSTILWSADATRFAVSGCVSEAELLRMAEGVG